jgi:hypothetical protein
VQVIELQVTTVPPGADVILDGERLGASPVEVKHAPAAQATITVRHTGYKDVTRSVVLDRDQVLELTLLPKREKLVVRSARPTPAKAPSPQPKEHHTSDLRNPFE